MSAHLFVCLSVSVSVSGLEQSVGPFVRRFGLFVCHPTHKFKGGVLLAHPGDPEPPLSCYGVCVLSCVLSAFEAFSLLRDRVM